MTRDNNEFLMDASEQCYSEIVGTRQVHIPTAIQGISGVNSAFAAAMCLSVDGMLEKAGEHKLRMEWRKMIFTEGSK